MPDYVVLLHDASRRLASAQQLGRVTGELIAWLDELRVARVLLATGIGGPLGVADLAASPSWWACLVIRAENDDDAYAVARTAPLAGDVVTGVVRLGFVEEADLAVHDG